MKEYYSLFLVVFIWSLPVSYTSYAMPSNDMANQQAAFIKKSKPHPKKRLKKKTSANWFSKWLQKRIEKKVKKSLSKSSYDRRETDYYAKASVVSFGLGVILAILLSNPISVFAFFASLIFSIVGIIRITRKPNQRKGLLLAIIPLGLIIGGIITIWISLGNCC